MRRLAVLAGLCMLVSSCYQLHEREAVVVDSGPAADDAASSCMSGLAATATLDPPMMGPLPGVRVVLLGVAADAASNGARLHLDVCGGMPPCPVDLVVSNVGDALAGITVPPGASGTLTTDATGAYVHVSDLRRCAGCGGDLDVLAGELTSSLDPGMRIHVERVECMDGCGDQRGISIAGHGGMTLASAGAPISAPPLTVRVATDYLEPCLRCDCALPPVPATGIIVAASGAFRP